MKLTQSGRDYDDESVLEPNRHSRNTYKKFIQSQLHQARTSVMDKSQLNEISLLDNQSSET